MTPPPARPLVDLTTPPPRGYGQRAGEARAVFGPLQLVCRTAV